MGNYSWITVRHFPKVLRVWYPALALSAGVSLFRMLDARQRMADRSLIHQGLAIGMLSVGALCAMGIVRACCLMVYVRTLGVEPGAALGQPRILRASTWIAAVISTGWFILGYLSLPVGRGGGMGMLAGAGFLLAGIDGGQIGRRQVRGIAIGVVFLLVAVTTGVSLARLMGRG